MAYCHRHSSEYLFSCHRCGDEEVHRRKVEERLREAQAAELRAQADRERSLALHEADRRERKEAADREAEEQRSARAEARIKEEDEEEDRWSRYLDDVRSRDPAEADRLGKQRADAIAQKRAEEAARAQLREHEGNGVLAVGLIVMAAFALIALSVGAWLVEALKQFGRH